MLQQYPGTEDTDVPDTAAATEAVMKDTVEEDIHIVPVSTATGSLVSLVPSRLQQFQHATEINNRGLFGIPYYVILKRRRCSHLSILGSWRQPNLHAFLPSVPEAYKCLMIEIDWGSTFSGSAYGIAAFQR